MCCLIEIKTVHRIASVTVRHHRQHSRLLASKARPTASLNILAPSALRVSGRCSGFCDKISRTPSPSVVKLTTISNDVASTTRSLLTIRFIQSKSLLCPKLLLTGTSLCFPFFFFFLLWGSSRSKQNLNQKFSLFLWLLWTSKDKLTDRRLPFSFF